MWSWLSFVVGLFVGGFFGLLVGALAAAAARRRGWKSNWSGTEIKSGVRLVYWDWGYPIRFPRPRASVDPHCYPSGGPE